MAEANNDSLIRNQIIGITKPRLKSFCAVVTFGRLAIRVKYFIWKKFKSDFISIINKKHFNCLFYKLMQIRPYLKLGAFKKCLRKQVSRSRSNPKLSIIVFDEIWMKSLHTFKSFLFVCHMKEKRNVVSKYNFFHYLQNGRRWRRGFTVVRLWILQIYIRQKITQEQSVQQVINNNTYAK